jgi:hypothetical protein
VGIKTLLSAAAGAALLAAALPAAAGPILLQDNFDANAQTLNWAGDSVFTSTAAPASVDLIGTGFFDFQPGHGNYLDLDGSTGNGNDPAGQITSVLTFGPGDYTLTFDLAGNQRGAASQSTTVSLGDFSQTFGPLLSGVNFTTQTISFSTTTAGHLVFSEHGPSDQQGNLLDNVKLTAGVPEPATWAMMLVGFGGMGALLRSRRRAALA